MSKRFFSSFQNGILRHHLIVIPLWAPHVIAKPREEARRSLGSGTSSKVFLVFGYDHPGKDLRTVVKAFEDINESVLVVAGKLSPKTKLLLISLQKLRGGVIVEDCHVDEARKPLFYCSADAVILSYVPDRLESASALFEACAYGIPIIASDSGYIGELIRRYDLGLLFEPSNPYSLRKTIKYFLGLKSDRIESLRANQIKFINDYSWEKWGRRTKDLLRSITR